MVLRDVTEDDLLIFFEQQRVPEANQLADWPARGYEAFMQHWRNHVLGSAHVTKQTIDVDGEVAGNIASWEQDGKRLVGYWLGKAYWGRGIASAALAGFVADHEPTRPLHAYVSVKNGGSIRVLEKSGFRQLGDVMTDPAGVEELLMQLR